MNAEEQLSLMNAQIENMFVMISKLTAKIAEVQAQNWSLEKVVQIYSQEIAHTKKQFSDEYRESCIKAQAEYVLKTKDQINEAVQIIKECKHSNIVSDLYDIKSKLKGIFSSCDCSCCD